MNRMIVVLALAATVVLSGCATKRYGRMQPLTSYETLNYNCEQIDLELSKVAAFDQQVAEQAKFSGMSVASFLGDFGIGNTIERNQAKATSAQRRAQLQEARVTKGCGTTTTSAAPQPRALQQDAIRQYRCIDEKGQPYITVTADPPAGCVVQ